MRNFLLLLLTLFMLRPAHAEDYTWTTLAGKAGEGGHADGTGGQARFNMPGGIAVDKEGNVYVADGTNYNIRKITPGGLVSTLAGKAGVAGRADGRGSEAGFCHPNGIAVDDSGTVYVADTWNNAIRRITPEGAVTTLAGRAGVSGSADGTGGQALFYGPQKLALDKSGIVYVADTYNHTIRRITPEGVVTTLAGRAGVTGEEDGAGDAARFNNPWSIAVDKGGTVFLTNAFKVMRKISPKGMVSTLTGRALSPDKEERFMHSGCIAVDGNGNL